MEQPSDIDATVAATVAATRTASDVQEKLSATVKKIVDEVSPLSVVHVNRGVDYFEDGRYENAIQEFNKAIQLAPDIAWQYYKRGVAYRKLGQYQRAV